MKKIDFIMGMPVIIEVIDNDNFDQVFDYLRQIDKKFSPYKKNSEVTKINDGRLSTKKRSKEMEEILDLSEKTKKETNGYFNIYRNNYMDPSGLVKGWAIYKASKILDKMGYQNYYINAGGDIQTKGLNSKNEKWAVGIRNPFNIHENIKIVYLNGEGIATSGTYEKGNHIYTPEQKIPDRNFHNTNTNDIVSLTVIGPNVYEADRFATATFAMGIKGINFIEKQKELEGYMIERCGIATMTSGFEKYVK